MNLNQKSDDKLISKLFFSMLPVQVLIFAMGSINTIVDGIIAGRFIDAEAIGIVGLYFPMVNLMNAVGYTLLGGTAVLCGRYMGRCELDKRDGVFSLTLTVTFIAGAVLSAASLLLPGVVATMLGAQGELKDGLVLYIMGYGIGILPMLLAQQLAAFLQMELQTVRGYIGVAGMIVSNVALDILLVGVLDKGILGLALATTLSNLTYFLILVPYYFTSKAQMRYSLKNVLWADFGELIKIGFPGALLVLCLAVRGMIINRVLLTYAGTDGLSALSSFNLVSGFFIAYCLGNGAVVRILVSVFIGEEDRAAIKKTLKIVLTKGLAIGIIFAAAVFALSPVLTALFFPDRTAVVYHLAYQLFAIYAFCIPLVLICPVITNYLQAVGRNLFVNITSVFDGFFSMLIPALILAPIMGAMGVWISNPIGIVLTILTVPVFVICHLKRMPRSLDDWLFLEPDFGVPAEDVLDISIHDTEEVGLTSERIQSFCEGHGLGKKAAYYSALCLEEMAGNVVEHGFTADTKKHSLNTVVVFKSGEITLRIKDNCKPFNPTEFVELISDKDRMDNIGIRIVFALADDVNYQNLLGLNVLTIKIKEADTGHYMMNN